MVADSESIAMFQNNSEYGYCIKIILIHVIGLILFYSIVGLEWMSESKKQNFGLKWCTKKSQNYSSYAIICILFKKCIG